MTMLTANDCHSLKSIFIFFKRDITRIKLLSSLPIISAFAVTIIIGYLFNHFYLSGSDITIYILLSMLILTSLLLNFINKLNFASVNHKVVSQVMPIIWQHIWSLPISYLQQRHSSELTKLIYEYESALALIITQFLSLTNHLILISLLLIMMLYFDEPLTFLCIAFYCLLLIYKVLIYPHYSRLSQAQLRAQIQTESFLTENLMHISKIRTANREAVIIAKWRSLYFYGKTIFRQLFYFELNLQLIELAAPIIFTLVIFICFYIQTINTSSLSFILCFGQLSLLYEKFNADLLLFIKVHQSFKRIKPLLSHPIETPQLTSYSYPFSGHIELINCSTSTLTNVSLTIEPGKFTAFIGASGGGKSSVFRLILGFEPLVSGNLFYDHLSSKDLNINEIRKHFGVVLQNSSLFPRTIFSNITANNHLTLDEVWELAANIGLAEDIQAMPMKMFTYVSDSSGHALSGGQKQKILLARALAGKPKILMLDEATSALDNISQAVIFKYLKSLNITLIVIAHRQSTITDADNIYFVDKGTASIFRHADIITPA